jgi:hypothetical protein
MNLTEKSVSNLEPIEKRKDYYDDEGGGFGVRVESAQLGGRKSFFWRQKINRQVYYRSLGESPIVQ